MTRSDIGGKFYLGPIASRNDNTKGAMMKNRLFSGGLLLVLLSSAPAFSQQLGRVLYVSNTDPACGGHSPCFHYEKSS